MESSGDVGSCRVLSGLLLADRGLHNLLTISDWTPTGLTKTTTRNVCSTVPVVSIWDHAGNPPPPPPQVLYYPPMPHFILPDRARIAFDVLGATHLNRTAPIVLIGGLSSVRRDWARLANSLSRVRPGSLLFSILTR